MRASGCEIHSLVYRLDRMNQDVLMIDEWSEGFYEGLVRNEVVSK